MIADSRILSLAKVSLEARELLPEQSGTYYVIDQHNVIVYIGQAKNLRSRWQGKSHHRFNQLKVSKNRSFWLYYELIPDSQLDETEKILINKFNPELNNSYVFQGKTNFTEGLLKETLRKIDGYILILGFNPQTNIIHLVLDYGQFKKDFKVNKNTQSTFLNWIFKSRKIYPNKWEHNRFKYFSFASLVVNGYAVQIDNLNQFKFRKHLRLQDFNHRHIDFVGESIPCITEKNLIKLKSQNSTLDFLQNLISYQVGMLKYFQSPLKLLSVEEYQQKRQQLKHELAIGKRGVGSQSSKKAKTLLFIDQLISQRKISSKEFPKIVRRGRGRYSSTEIDVFIQCFNLSASSKMEVQSITYSKLNRKNRRKSISQFKSIYLLSQCNKKIWLLLEEYLSDFVQVGIDLSHKDFPEDTCYTEKLYVSPRRWIKPARLMIKFEGTESGFGIPFGTNWQNVSMNFEDVKKEIKSRLSQSNLPEHKLTFVKETIYTKGRRKR